MAELAPSPSPSSSSSTVSSTTSRVLALPEPLKRRPKPQEKVLDEDTYIEALQTIIQRDFFPDKPKLEAQIEWMEAERMNDVDKMRVLQQRMLSSRRPTTVRATPRATPKGFETPSGATPNVANTPLGGATPSSSSMSATASQGDSGSSANLNLNVSLDKFIERHTSEDDASFGTIMEKQHERHVEKYGWVESKTQEAAVMLIEASKKDDNGHFPAIQSWNYTVRNQLMFVPDGEDASLMPPPPPGPPKAILHRNTRITGSVNAVTAAAIRKGDKDAVWAHMSNTADPKLPKVDSSKVDLGDLGVGASPKVGGYGFMATPSPAPGVDMSPMTTWGRLDGTPMLLDPTDTPLDLTPGPSFKIAASPRREEIAMKLADRAKESQKSKARAYSASPYARPNSAALSPAAKTLMASKMHAKMHAKKGSVGADMQLRASYNSPAVGNRSGALKGSAVTPSPFRPTPSPLTTKAPTPSHAPSSSSITDNLLDIPSSSSAKSKKRSITDDLLI